MHGSSGMPHRAPVALAFALAMALQGCGKRESEYEQAKARYDFLKAHRATAAELCEEGKKVVAAAADERHENFDIIKITHDADCTAALIEKLR